MAKETNSKNEHGEMKIGMDVAGHKGVASLSVVTEGTEESSNIPKAKKKAEDPDHKTVTLSDAIEVRAIADYRPDAIPKVPPVAKPVRVKFETETGAVYQNFPTYDEAIAAANKGVHEGIVQRLTGRLIYHAPHVVHRAIIDM